MAYRLAELFSMNIHPDRIVRYSNKTTIIAFANTKIYLYEITIYLNSGNNLAIFHNSEVNKNRIFLPNYKI